MMARRMRRIMVLAAMASVAAPGMVEEAVAAAGLLSHRAAYGLSLESAHPGSGITAAEGLMAYEWRDVCDGYATQQRFLLKVTRAGGDDFSLGSDYVTWESKDGLRLRFRTRHYDDGKLREELAGEARLEGLGKRGTASFSEPETFEVALPPGTLFPTEHTSAMLAAARAGKNRFARTIFDGTTRSGPQEINAVVGQRREGAATAPFEPLKGMASWYVRLAFFDLGSAAATPVFELGTRYYDNGVADDVVMDFGDFSVSVRLSRLDPLPGLGC
ncbi:MAG: cell envelope integrity EipB family protein [Proteobacteria bacterium]|nr:cell envelope integrity EipB family protein [Pseudomonadota bacterium]